MKAYLHSAVQEAVIESRSIPQSLGGVEDARVPGVVPRVLRPQLARGRRHRGSHLVSPPRHFVFVTLAGHFKGLSEKDRMS